MSLKSNLEQDLKDAMRSKNDLNKTVIRMLLSAVKLREIEKGAPLDDGELISVVQKEIKSRLESIEDAEKLDRTDIIESSNAEIQVLESYLPPSLSPQKLEEMARKAIEEVGANNIRQMGQVMKILVPRLEGRASGSEASNIVRKLLL
jgi:uncharacterized protein YqeY